MGKAKTYPAEAVIELSGGLQLGPDFLGLSKPATIGGVDVQVSLPEFKRSKDGYDFDAVIDPRAQADWVGFFEKRDPEEEREWPFGSVSRAQDRGEIEEFFAARLLALPKGTVTLEEARSLKRSVDDWTRLLETWIEVVAREDLQRDRVTVDRQGQSAFVWIDRGKRPRGGLLGGKDEIRIDFGSRLSITPPQWGKILAKASDGEQPQEAHLFLRDARKARNAGHRRRSVLDSATAAELGLAKLAEDALAGTAPQLAAYVSKSLRQIQQLANFLRAVNASPPENITEDIAEPRNAAIHKGREPDGEAADKAFEKAEEIVGLAYPWRQLL